MSLVKQISLGLNIIVPGYFFFYQLYQQDELFSQNTNILIQLLKAAIVLLSPMFHILALLSPSYCFKGHCTAPHHYKNPFQQQQKHTQIPNTYQPTNIYSRSKYKDDLNNKNFPQFKDDLKQRDNIKFHDDLIQESIASSKDELYPKKQFTNETLKELQRRNSQNYDHFLSRKQAIQTGKIQVIQKGNKQVIETGKDVDNPDVNSKERVIFCGIDSPPVLSKFSASYQQQKEVQTINNVNQFSNIPFFRSSHKSVSNMGNSESPRFSRRSIVQVGQPQMIQPTMIQRSIRQPFFKLTPVKIRKSRSQQRVIDYNSNRKDNGDRNQSQQYVPYQPYLFKSPHIDNDESVEQMRIQCEFCQQCQIPKYLRMKHCYRCEKCVHKYDHHCVLLNICIGQRNQKYYIAFLYAHFYNTCIVLNELLKDIKDNVYIDMSTGIETIDDLYVLKAICIILLMLNFVLTIYLVFIHTGFLFNGSTTYEKERKLTINYFKYIRKNYQHYSALKDMDKEQIQNYHPFDHGPIHNAINIITASKTPYDWKLPFHQQTSIIEQMQEMKDMKEMAKNASNRNNHRRKNYAYQWGQQSESSNLHAGKTTKSRQSALRKSKQIEERHKQKDICR